MCGIAGVLDLRNTGGSSGPNSRKVEMENMVSEMLRLLSHRGPDGEGIWASDSIVLGHRRLAIIDLSDAGRQPMSHPDVGTWISANGEIFNYQSIMTDLKSRGHVFESQCDSEVFIHAYREYGIDMLKQLNGMWALSLWDAQNRTLYLCRDRIGVKPLYYCTVDKYLIFASEVKALLPFLPRPIKINQRYLYKILNWHLDDPLETNVDGIHAVPAGGMVCVCDDGQLKTKHYWQVPEVADDRPPARLTRKALMDFKALFTNAVKLRMISDAPLTYFLSGGMDSSSIVATASAITGHGVTTFSTVFDDQGYNEGPYVRELIDHFKTQATVMTPSPDGSLLETIEKIVWALDGPVTAQGTILQWYLFQNIREKMNCKVVLSGNGGDEVLGGYLPYFRSYLNSLVFEYVTSRNRRRMLQFFLESNEMRRIYGKNYIHSYPSYALKKHPRLKRLVEWHRLHLEEGAREVVVATTPLLNKDFINQFKGTLRPQAELFEHQVRLGLTRTIMPGLLRYEDRMSMAWGVEARQPFLDFRLVESLSQMHYRILTHGTQTKYILREAMRGILPESVRTRKDKMGFPIPFGRWIRTTERDAIKDGLFSLILKFPEYFNAPAVTQLWDQHQAGELDASKHLFILLSTGIWLEKIGRI